MKIVQYLLKFFAILKDSLQETLDSKVLYALFVLSALVILGTASISFEPKSPQKGIESILARFPGAKSNPFIAREAPLRYELQDFKQTNEKQPWESDYQFTIVVHEQALEGPDGKPQPVKGMFHLMVYASALQMDEANMTDEERQARKDLLQLQREALRGQNDKVEALLKKIAEEPLTPGQMERFVSRELAAQGTLVTKNVRFAPAAKDEVRFEVETQSRSETIRTWPHKMVIGFGAYTWNEDIPVGDEVFVVEDKVIGGFGAGISMLIASIVTSFYIPNMLRKGTVDLLLAKPIPRWLLLVYKYVGGLLFMLLNTVVVVVGIWLVLGFRSGLWAPGFLLCIFVLTFQFAIFYAVSTLCAVTTRSPIVCILAACFTWLILWSVGTLHLFADATREIDLLPKWVDTSAATTNFCLPRYKDLDILSGQATARDLIGPDSPERKSMDKTYANITWWQSIGFTLAWIALLVGFSCWWFSSKDY
jgi:ABC-type transport system involved in multi-copper enzyme maturation permease subunit